MSAARSGRLLRSTRRCWLRRAGSREPLEIHGLPVTATLAELFDQSATLAKLLAKLFDQVIYADFEFIAKPGEPPDVVCLAWREEPSGRTYQLWRDQLGATPPYRTDNRALFICFVGNAELHCHLALGWPLPANVLDLSAEFRHVTNGRIEWDDGPYRIFDVDPATFQPTVERIEAMIHPDDRAKSSLAAILDDDLSRFQVEFRIVRPSGEVRWCYGAGIISRDADGKAVRMNGVTVDITER